MKIKKILQFAIGPIGAAGLSVLIIPTLSWYYSTEDIGRLAMLTTATSFCVLLFSLGLDQAYVREYNEVQDKHALLRAVLAPTLLLLCITLLMFEVSSTSLSEILFHKKSAIISFLLNLSIILVFLSRFLGLVLRMQERALAYSLSQLLPKVFLLLLIISYVCFSVEASFEYLLFANVFSSLIVFLILVWNIRYDLLKASFCHIDKEKLKGMLNYGIPLIFSGIAYWGLTAIDRFFLRELSSYEELGIYSVAINFAAVALILQNVFTTVWVPIVYKWIADGVDVNKITNVSDGLLMLVVILFCVLGMFSWLISYILPPDYVEVQYIVIPCLAAPFFYTLSEVTGVGVGIRRKSVFSLMSTVIALLVNIAINYALIPLYGAKGAAIASAISFAVFFLIKTECSNYLWKKVPRLHVYLFIVILLFGCILHVLIAQYFFFEVVLFWFFTLCGSLLFFKRIINKLYSNIKSFKYES
ncbi:oligosaccharide flippase family protein [Vibrio sp. RE86]|uniref:lipopolysaccharide biosynthesis protein n=1 Tax=Vibrio sp. RE86 TaxID=2607605 RepID=UPI0014938EF8|nr:oligosaccharide flippase family protein [Vibrio sp. RE86]NOH80818.1 oligosaccharide flippase family protein [Vibrio sp. RE86]